MSSRYVLESLLRPAVELNVALVSASAAVICAVAPWAVALAPSVSYVMAGGFALLSIIRIRQGLYILRYRRGLKRLPRYVIRNSIPCSQKYLFIGKGFRWQQKHLQRLLETRRPEVLSYLQPSWLYRLARHIDGHVPLLAVDSWLNPVRPDPPVGGDPALHGVEPQEVPVNMDLRERVGHMLVLGTTRVGKTRLAEILISQDIHRKDGPVIVFDPKGDADLLKRIWAEAHRSGRADDLYIFHLGWPEISARYNGIGRFGRVSEVAGRIANQLSSEGNSAAFKEFAWRMVNIIAQCLSMMGEQPDYQKIRRYVMDMGKMYDKFVPWYLAENAPQLLEKSNSLLALLRQDRKNQAAGEIYLRRMAIEEVLNGEGESELLIEPVFESLRNAMRYDQKYFDKIVASLLPLLEKLTSGKVAALLSPDYQDLDDPRPLLDWQQIILHRGVVYVGLDSLSDTEVAQAVGNSMFADLVSVAGQIYKTGANDGPGSDTVKSSLKISLHCDEFNELMGPEFIPMVNKAGGAGFQVTAYTQTWSDIEARIGSAAKAAQVTGNFNSIIMLRVREKTTAELLTSQLPEVDVYSKTLMSGFTDISRPEQGSDFTSNTQDRLSSVRMPLLSPAELMSLPKGQAYALLEGGHLWKLRLPLPAPVNDRYMPQSISQLADMMHRQHQVEKETQ